MKRACALSLCDVSYATPDGRALGQGISAKLYSGECLLITGPNGSGKSTLLEIILGATAASAGTVCLNVSDRAISYLPQLQDNRTHLPMSLRDVVEVSVAGHLTDSHICSYGLLTTHHLPLAWNNASGGERRRALLTRTLLQEPDLIVLDEPFNHLDVESRNAMAASLFEFLAMPGKCVVLSSHEGFGQYLGGSPPTIKRIAL